MRILLIVDSFLPEPKATGPMFRSLSAELTRRGHSVTILTVAQQSARCTIEQTPYATVIRARAPKLKGVNLVLRGIRELRLSSLVWKNAGSALASLKADLIAFYSPTIFWGPLVARLKRRWNARTVLILRDIFPQWALDAGEIRRGPHFSLLEHYAGLQYEAADVIGIQSPANREFFDHHQPKYLRRTEVLYNWIEPPSPTLEQFDVREHLSISRNSPIFLYGGNLGPAQDAPLLPALADRVADRGHVLVVGEGLAFRELRESASSRDNLHILDSVPQERFLSVALQCDLGLILLNRNLKTHNVPGKLLTYVEAGLPVLASVNRGNDLAELIHSHNAGLCCFADVPEDFLANAELLLDQAVRRAFSAQQLAQIFSVEAAAAFLLDAAKR